MKKNLTRLLSILLALVLTVGMLPVSALADGWQLSGSLERGESAGMAESIGTQAATTDNFRIVHLDCGRKYFSVENIKKLIDTMAQYGYNQLQLAFGNGGCRFLLDDMSLEFAGSNNVTVSMDSNTVKTNITNGNYSFNGDTRYLDQSDMDTIITYANGKGIEIVPMLNMPGHATAIVYGTEYASSGNLNINDETARNYGVALLQKYAAYFSGKGCKYFHFGSDESGYTGSNMTAFLAACTSAIKAFHMTPRAFNDATNVATMPTDVQITYWHRENGSKTASALMNAGYSMINTHGRWYYVIKTAQNSEIGTKYWQGTVNSSPVSVELPVMKAEKMDEKWVDLNEYFDGNPGYGSTISNSLGTMFCIWCDASQDAYLTDSDVISENENYGALYQLEKLAEHYWPEDIKEEPVPTLPTVTQPDGTALPTTITVGKALELKASTTVTWTTTDKSVIELLDPTNGDSQSITGTSVLAVAQGAGTATITVTDKDGNTASYTLEVTADATQPSEQDVTLAVGESRTFDVDSSISTGSYITDNAAYIATADVKAGEAQNASLREVTSIESGKSYLISNNRRAKNGDGSLLTTSTTTWTSNYSTYNCLLLSGTASAGSIALWTLTGSGTGYTAEAATNQYLNIGNNTASVSSTSSTLTFAYNATGKYWNISYNSYYLNNLGDTGAAGGWRSSSAHTDEGSRWTLYEIVPGTPASNTLTITGVGEGTKDVTIDNVTYHITVTAPEKTESHALTRGGSMTLPTGADDVTVTGGNNVVTIEGNKIVAGSTDGNATVTFTVKNAGGYVTAHYTYNIAVTEIDLDNVDPLSVQLWITNTYVGKDASPDTKANEAEKIQIKAADAYGEDGIALSKFAPSPAYKTDNDKPIVFFWKGTVLHNGTKPTQGGTDYSNSGDTFTTIRYWNNEWQYLNGTEWTTIDTSDDKDTVIAYYLQINNVSPEITTGTKDYGNPPSTSSPGYSKNGFCLTAFAVVYPDGTLSRTEEEMYKTGMLRGFYGGTSNGLGVVYAENNSTYKIAKMTLTWGNNIVSNDDYGNNWKASGVYGTNYGVKWEKKTNSAGVEWYDETAYWQAGDSDIPMINGDTLGLKLTTEKNAALILIYLEVVETADTLSVVYWDDNTNERIPTNPIAIDVEAGKTFFDIQNNRVTIPTDGTHFELDDSAYITNKNEQTQGFNKELSTVPGVSGIYLSGMYQYIDAEVSTDGKTLTLHYNLKNPNKQNTYVIDFGLPLVINASDFGIENVSTVDYVSLEAGTTNTTDKVGSFGRAVISGDKQTVTYTLIKPLTTGRVTIPLYVKFSGESAAQLFQAHIVPASNVLYEENFLTEVEGDRPGWTADDTQKLTGTAQVAHKAADEARFGYDVAYESVTGRNGAWTTSVSKDATVSNALTATFYGNALDVIGSCGADTAMLMFVIRTPGEKAKSVLVDTRYSEGTLEQVPFAHIELGDTDAQHTVLVRAYYAAATTANGNSAVSVMSARASSGSSAERLVLAQMERDLAEDGLTLSDVEFVNAADTLTARSSASIASYAAVNAATIARSEGTKAAIDAFRVYRSTDNASYIDSEKGVVYKNVLDAIDGEVVTAYREGDDGSSAEVAITDYESTGGPQNEIYLRNGDSVVFAVADAAATQIQVSLRAVSEETNWNGNVISSNTEMYYVLNKAADSDGKQVFAITNTGYELLAIGNVKLPADTGTNDIIPASELPTDVVLQALRAVSGEEPSEPEPEVFEPDTFDANVSTLRLLRSKLVTIRISVSSDVSYVTVNGVTYWPGRTFSWQRSRTVQFRDTIGRSESKTYTIIAYDANGVASAPITVNG